MHCVQMACSGLSVCSSLRSSYSTEFKAFRGRAAVAGTGGDYYYYSMQRHFVFSLFIKISRRQRAGKQKEHVRAARQPLH